MAFDMIDSTIHAVIYIVLSIIMEKCMHKLKKNNIIAKIRIYYIRKI